MILVSTRQIRSDIEQTLPINIGEVGVEETRVRMTFYKDSEALTEGDLQGLVRLLKSRFPMADVSAYGSSEKGGLLTIEFGEDIKERQG